MPSEWKHKKKASHGFVLDEDDETIGTIYTRRRTLAALGGVGAAVLLGACGDSEGVPNSDSIEAANTALPVGCVVRPALTEGPIFVDDQANRSDIRSDPSTGAISEGAALSLTFRVSTLGGSDCVPLEGAQVDLWHCDAFGIYSDTNYENMGTVGQKFLRGHQFTDANGDAAFTTVYPGWYDGRAVHVHFKVRPNDGQEFASQLFFDPALTDKVYAEAPYNTRGERTVRNSADGIAEQSGDQMILDVAANGDGYEATFNITLDMA